MVFLIPLSRIWSTTASSNFPDGQIWRPPFLSVRLAYQVVPHGVILAVQFRVGSIGKPTNCSFAKDGSHSEVTQTKKSWSVCLRDTRLHFVVAT